MDGSKQETEAAASSTIIADENVSSSLQPSEMHAEKLKLASDLREKQYSWPTTAVLEEIDRKQKEIERSGGNSKQDVSHVDEYKRKLDNLREKFHKIERIKCKTIGEVDQYMLILSEAWRLLGDPT